MKKFLISLFSLSLVSATLLSSGCSDTFPPSGTTHPSAGVTSPSDFPSQSATKYPGATVPVQSSSQTESTSQSDFTSQYTTKYPPATVPSQPTQSTTTQTEATDPPSTEVAGGVTDKDITDEEIAKLVTKKYLTKRERSRSGNKLNELKEIVVHYVANKGTTALQNWNYFETQNQTYVSAHFIIDLDGSILQCMPLDEVAWAIGTTEGNYSTISIECCHPDSTGKFTDATYESLVKLVSWLCNEYGLSVDNVKRHYDYPRNTNGVIWHKQCPLYFVNHPEKWEEFKNSLLIR